MKRPSTILLHFDNLNGKDYHLAEMEEHLPQYIRGETSYEVIVLCKNGIFLKGWIVNDSCRTDAAHYGSIYLDHGKCYDKLSKCPLVLPLPRTEKELQFLYKKMLWLSRPNGYKVSNEYETEKWIYKYPEL